jgi:hypothetical protein
MRSDKERHHLSQNTAQHTNEKLNQLVNGDKNRHRYKNKEEHEDSRYKQEKRSGQPLESGKNKVNQLTTCFQNDTHKAEQENNAEYKVNQHPDSERKRIKHVTAKREEIANIRKNKQQIRYQSHTFPSVPAPVSK